MTLFGNLIPLDRYQMSQHHKCLVIFLTQVRHLLQSLLPLNLTVKQTSNSYAMKGKLDWLHFLCQRQYHTRQILQNLSTFMSGPIKTFRHCYNWYFLLNGLSTFSLVHLILLQHVIILSQGTLSLIYFLMKSMISPMLSQPSFNLYAVHGYAFFSSLPFDALCITHVYTSILCTAYLISTTHSPGLRVFLMHSVSVDLIPSYTNIMSSI